MKKLFLILIILLLPSSVQAVTRYVHSICPSSPTANYNPLGNGGAGSCTGGGGSTPSYPTIAAGIAATQAGDSLYIRGGTYNERLNSNSVAFKSGTSFSNAPLISGYPGETVIIMPSSAGGGIVNFASSAASPNLRYVIWQDLIVDGSNNNTGDHAVGVGFGSPAAQNIRFNRVTVRNNNANFLSISTVGGGIIVDGTGHEFINVISHSNGRKPGAVAPEAPYGYYLGGSDTLIQGGEVRDNGGYGIHGFRSGGGSNNNRIIGVKVYNNGQTAGGSSKGAGILVGSGSGHLVFNNEVYDGGGLGLEVGSNCSSCLIYHNTVYGNASGGVYWIGNATFRNNIFRNNGGNNIDKDGGATGTADYNACSGTGGTSQCSGANNITSDPRMVDPANADFRLCAASGNPHPNCTAISPVIDEGETLGSPYNVDRNGTARPVGIGYDMGANESGVTDPVEPDPLVVVEISCDDTVVDSSGLNNDGTLTGGATYSSSGKYNAACSFDGVNDYVNVADSATLDITHGFTMAAWVFPTSSMTDFRTIMIKSYVYYLYASSEAGFCGSAGALFAGYEAGGSAAYACLSTPLTANVWTHVAATYDRTSIKIYINGSLATSASGSAFMPATTGALTIGASEFGEYFPGRIDEIYVRNSALTDAEVVTLMNTPINSIVIPPSSPTLRIGGVMRFGSGTSIKIAPVEE
jgi:hypothetical protein